VQRASFLKRGDDPYRSNPDPIQNDSGRDRGHDEGHPFVPRPVHEKRKGNGDRQQGRYVIDPVAGFGDLQVDMRKGDVLLRQEGRHAEHFQHV